MQAGGTHALVKKQKVLVGPPLYLRCREIYDVAVKVADLVSPAFSKVAEDTKVYTFKQRTKSPQKIYDKVIRKRTDGKLQKDEKLTTYNPDHVTDAWACRYVTLYQNQIPRTVESILATVEEFNRQSSTPNLTLSEFVIYTNRPAADPLSITNEVMAILHDAKFKRMVGRKAKIRQPENKKSAYSSVHLVFSIPVTVDLFHRREAVQSGKFEVQVRDIFEEGWGEIQHNLLYSRKDGSNHVAEEDDSATPWKPHLNALKTFVDGCSQHASIIRTSYEYIRASRSPSPWMSISSREQDKNAIVSRLRQNDKAEAAQIVELAYDLLSDATEQGDVRAAYDGFMAAAAVLEDLLKKLNKHLLEMLPNRHNRTIEYFLKLELANCYLFARKQAPLKDLLRAKELCTEMIDRFQQDATLRFRLAMVIPWLNDKAPDYDAAIEELEKCLSLIEHDTSLARHHWLRLSAGTQLGRLFWLKSRTLAKSKNQKLRARLLSQAVIATNNVVKAWEREPEAEKHEHTHMLFAHKAASNVLYYLAKLVVLGEPRKPELRAAIRRFDAISVAPYAEQYKSRDNLMHAKYALGDLKAATTLAYDIQSELVGLAEHRAGRRLEIAEIQRYLSDAELPNFESATRVTSGKGLEVEA